VGPPGCIEIATPGADLQHHRKTTIANSGWIFGVTPGFSENLTRRISAISDSQRPEGASIPISGTFWLEFSAPLVHMLLLFS